jgi:uncharacterized protein
MNCSPADARPSAEAGAPAGSRPLITLPAVRLLRRALRFLLGAPLALLLAGGPARAAVSIPAVPPDYVVDLAGVIDEAAEQRLDGALRELEQKTTAQVVVLTVDTLDGQAIESFTLDLAHNRWRLGQKGKDNGVLIAVAVQERRYRFEVGYGLEGVLPDSAVGSMGRELLVPALRRGDYAGGLSAVTLAIAGQIAAGAGVELQGVPARVYRPAGARRGQGAPPGPLAKALGLLVLVGLVVLFIKNPRLLILLMMMSQGGGRSSGWSGGGGGFGGGGGGGFGGGGSSGSW